MNSIALPSARPSEELREDRVTTVLAVLGVTLTPNGIHIVQGIDKRHRCLVYSTFGKSFAQPDQQISVPIEDCTLFYIDHPNERYDESLSPGWLNHLLEQSLSAVSELTIWSKHHEQEGLETRYWSRSGIIDAKYFALFAPQGDLISADWVNERFRFATSALHMMSGFLANMVVENSQYNYPLSPHARKLLNCIDILNKGFYEESLISAFSLVDATAQDTAKAGLKTLGLNEKQQENRIRAIKQDRLEHFLCAMMKSCRWKSLKESEPGLFREFIGDVKRSTNTVRNKIAHKDRRINKEEAMRHLDVMFRVLRWLSQNPFGVQIRLPPELRYANPNFRTNIPVGDPQNEPRASREPETAE